MSCPRCGSENGVLVAYGVDGEGEWETCECGECARVWMERSTAMLVNGYEIGQEPTDEEFAIYRKVRAFNDRLDVATVLKDIECGYENPEDGRLTQDEFDRMCYRFAKLDFSDSLWSAVEWEYDEIIGERS